MPDTHSLPELPSLRARFSWAKNREGLSLEALSQRLESPVNWLTLRLIEQGHTDRLTPQLSEDLSKALNVDRGWLTTDPVPQKEEKPLLATTATARVLSATTPAKKPATVWVPGTMKAVDATTLSGKVRAARLKIGVSQIQLGKKIASETNTRINDSVISYIERDHYKKFVRPDVVDRVMNYLGVEDAAWEQYKKTLNTIPAPKEKAPAPTPIAAMPVHTLLHTIPGAGERVKLLREKHGYTQERVAMGVGCYQTAISRIERGLETVPVSVPALAAFLETTVDYIMQGDGTEPAAAMPVIPPSSLRAAKKEARRKAGTPMPAPVLPDPAPATPTDTGVEGELIRPRQVDQVRTVADKTGIYLFCAQRVFRRKGQVLAPLSNSVSNLALSPETAEMLIEDLKDAIKQTRDLRRG